MAVNFFSVNVWPFSINLIFFASISNYETFFLLSEVYPFCGGYGEFAD